MNCPKCSSTAFRRGTYRRSSDGKRIQRYQCRTCHSSFSDQTCRIDYRFRLRHIDQQVFLLLCSGQSQRRCAYLLKTKPATIARRIVRFGAITRHNLKAYRQTRKKVTHALFDELETFEHTKCKPVTIPIAVEEKTRKILALEVGRIPAKGLLARPARKKYGPRPCERARTLDSLLCQLSECCTPTVCIKTDKSGFYPPKIQAAFPLATHTRYKGRRGCVVGQGELKAGGWDPLFTLNHTYAMIRDNLKTLARRTWCTVKRLDRLQDLLSIYSWFHNLYVENPKTVTLHSLKNHHLKGAV